MDLPSSFITYDKEGQTLLFPRHCAFKPNWDQIKEMAKTFWTSRTMGGKEPTQQDMFLAGFNTAWDSLQDFEYFNEKAFKHVEGRFFRIKLPDGSELNCRRVSDGTFWNKRLMIFIKPAQVYMYKAIPPDEEL